jgi:hypothetical protein
MLVERGGKFKIAPTGHPVPHAGAGRRHALADYTETIFRDGDAPGNSSTAKVGGGAVAGAILEAILGGPRARLSAPAPVPAPARPRLWPAVAARPFQQAPVTARMVSPVTVTIEK